MHSLSPRAQRAFELLVDRDGGSLADPDVAQLALLMREHAFVEGELEIAMAAAALVTMGDVEPMPASVMDRVATAAGLTPEPGQPVRTADGGRRTAANVVPFPTRPSPLAWAGWVVAAAAVILLAAAWILREPRPIAVVPPPPPPPTSAPVPPPAPSPGELRAKMLARTDVVRASWVATKDPAAKGAGGDVVWSPSEQKGYMRFSGLAANDPRKAQYQLWIFDKNQDAKTPVDGGVFDVDRATGDVIVPITAKLQVVDPTLFAVTVEKPGGVVVSKRERIVVTASPRA